MNFETNVFTSTDPRTTMHNLPSLNRDRTRQTICQSAGFSNWTPPVIDVIGHPFSVATGDTQEDVTAVQFPPELHAPTAPMSPNLNPLLAIASHQWFDRLFNQRHDELSSGCSAKNARNDIRRGLKSAYFGSKMGEPVANYHPDDMPQGALDDTTEIVANISTVDGAKCSSSPLVPYQKQFAKYTTELEHAYDADIKESNMRAGKNDSYAILATDAGTKSLKMGAESVNFQPTSARPRGMHNSLGMETDTIEAGPVSIKGRRAYPAHSKLESLLESQLTSSCPGRLREQCVDERFTATTLDSIDHVKDEADTLIQYNANRLPSYFVQQSNITKDRVQDQEIDKYSAFRITQTRDQHFGLQVPPNNTYLPVSLSLTRPTSHCKEQSTVAYFHSVGWSLPNEPQSANNSVSPSPFASQVYDQQNNHEEEEAPLHHLSLICCNQATSDNDIYSTQLPSGYCPPYLVPNGCPRYSTTCSSYSQSQSPNSHIIKSTDPLWQQSCSMNHATNYQLCNPMSVCPSFVPHSFSSHGYSGSSLNIDQFSVAKPEEHQATDHTPHELEAFSERFKQRRIKLGVTQADVGKALGNLKIAGVGSLSQSTICRFESLTLSHNNMIALKPVLQAWLEEAEAEAAERSRHPEIYDPDCDLRRKRTSITDAEKRSLEAFFNVQPRPSSEKIAQIAQKLNLKKNVVRVWFCNQRQKQKRMKFSSIGLLGPSVPYN